MRTILFAAALILVGGSAHAQAWNTVISKDGQRLDFDAASVVQNGEVITFTARTTFEQPMAYVSTDGRTLEGVSVALESFAVDCAARTYSDHGLQYSDATGGLIAGESAVGPAKPIGSPSASLVGGLIATICPASSRPGGAMRAACLKTAVLIADMWRCTSGSPSVCNAVLPAARGF